MQAILRTCRNLFVRPATTDVQNRSVYTDWRMYRDYKRRQVLRAHHFERNQLQAIRKNNIMPKAIQELAKEDLMKLPRDSSFLQIHQRCVLTSRARTVCLRYRLARMSFRHLADYNKLSGVQKAMW